MEFCLSGILRKFATVLEIIKMKLFAQALMIFLPLSIYSQQAVFEAYSDAKQVTLNSYAEVIFTLKNANGSDFIPPDFSGFNIVTGPNTSSSVQIINGVVSKEISYSYTLQPLKTGKFIIGSATINVGRKKLRSNSLQIEVVKGKNSSKDKSNAEPAFLQILLNKKIAYPGEQLLLEYKLYSSVIVEGFEVVTEPDFQGFFSMELKRYDTRTQREIINGKEYMTKVLRSITLFPQQTGKLTIPASTVRIAVADEENDAGFFFGRSIKPVMLTSEEQSVEVLPLPDDAPASFTGAVGNYEFEASVNRNSATTDDAISMMVTIKGNGDMKRVQPPTLLSNDTFEVYAPKLVDEQNFENQGEIVSTRVLEYLIVPKQAGSFTLEPRFSFFEPNTRTYKTLNIGPFKLEISKGSNQFSPASAPEKVGNKSDDIRYIKLNTILEKSSGVFTRSWIFWALFALPVLLFIITLSYRKKLDSDRQADPLQLKMRKANKEALKRMAVAEKHLKEGKSRLFYDEVSKASYGYVCDKLHIPLSELTKSNLLEKLQSLNVNSSLTNDFLMVIQRCEMALFAGLDNAEGMEDTYKKAIAAISGIEKEVGKS